MSPGDNRMEPDTVADTDEGHCLHSIAISLKRIADGIANEGHPRGDLLHWLGQISMDIRGSGR